MNIRSIHKFGTMPLLTIEGEEDGTGAGGPPAAPEPDESLTDEQKLEKEFGEDPPATETEPAPAGEAGEPTEGEGKPDDEGDQDENSVQKRINEATAKQREAERRASEAERTAESFRERLEKLEKGESAAPDPNAEPDPANYEFGEADAKFIADTATFHAKTAFREEAEAARVAAEYAQLDAKWQGEVAKAVETYPDFNEVVIEGADNNTWAASEVIALGLRDSEVGTDIAYHLAKNPDESKKIYKMHPLLQARKFGELEGRFLAERAAKAPPPPPKPSSAPKPPSNLARGAGGRFETPDDTDDFASFDAKHDVKRY